MRTGNLLAEVGIAKTNKYASRESGDTAELVERPEGGIAVILCDGQGTGRAAKTLSMLATSKAVALLKEGVRDGAVVRAVSDHLLAYRHGQVSVTLDVVSLDPRRDVVGVTRFSTLPLVVCRRGGCDLVDAAADPAGRQSLAEPAALELAVDADLTVVVVSDGIVNAGSRRGAALDVVSTVAASLGHGAPALADAVLDAAISSDHGRPNDDMSVVVLCVRRHDENPAVRRLSARVPFTDLPRAANGGPLG